jgi:hypothetical protein
LPPPLRWVSAKPMIPWKNTREIQQKREKIGNYSEKKNGVLLVHISCGIVERYLLKRLYTYVEHGF